MPYLTCTKQKLLLKGLGRSCCALALAGLAAPAALQAQEPNPGGAIVTGDAKLEEVIVTARRREESLARVPISISAIGAQDILERSIRTDSDLQAAVPGLTIRQTQGNNSLTYSIRGQSADTFSGSPSAVVTYVDEVPVAITGASTFYDLDSIQVLKGPQGTLFGRNATGGAVLYTTAKPTGEFEGVLRGRAGDYDLREVEGMINIPLADGKVLLRGVFTTLDRDGYIDNLFNGDELGELGRDGARLSMTIRPSDRLDNTTVFGLSDTDGTNTGASYTYSVYDCGRVNNGTPLKCDSAFLFSPLLDIAFDFPGAWDFYLAGNPRAFPAGLSAYVEEQKRLGYYKTNHPAGARHEAKDWQLSNTTTFDLSDNLRIKNIFGASHAETDSEQPQLGAPFVTILTANVATGKSGNEFEIDSLSNEFQLQGSAFNDNLTYIVGLFLQQQETETLWPQTYFDLRPVTPLPLGLATNHFGIDTDTEALYAQGTYSLTDSLGITAGLRYTWEDVTIEHLSEGDAAGFPDQDESFEEPSWELGLEYEITDQLFSYLKTRGSFRSGGFNGSAFPPFDGPATIGGNKFDVETTEDVEIGLKYNGSLFDRPASFNVAVYRQWIDDVQRVEFPDPPGDITSIAVTANVPKMEVDGLEIDGSIMAADWLELGISYAYTDAEFTDGEVQLFGVTYSYGPVANTPESAGSAWTVISLPTADSLGELRLRAEIYAQSSMYFSNTFDSIGPDTRLDGYELVNARLDWKNIFGSGFSGALFGRNLADEDHFVGGMALAAALGHNAAAVGEPRMYGLELSYEF